MKYLLFLALASSVTALTQYLDLQTCAQCMFKQQSWNWLTWCVDAGPYYRTCTDTPCGSAFIKDLMSCNLVEPFTLNNLTINATTNGQPMVLAVNMQPTDPLYAYVLSNRMTEPGNAVAFYFNYYMNNLVFYQTPYLNASGSPNNFDPNAYDPNLQLQASANFTKLARNCNGASCGLSLLPGQTVQIFVINPGSYEDTFIATYKGAIIRVALGTALLVGLAALYL